MNRVRILQVTLGLIILGVCAQAATTTQYYVQMSAVPSEADAGQLIRAYASRTQLPLQMIPFQGQYFVVAGEFSDPDSAKEAALDPALRDLVQLDVVKVVSESTDLKSGATVYQIQLGNFSTRGNAERIQGEARDRGLDPVQVMVIGGMYKVRFGQFASREAASSELPRVQNAGYDDAWLTSTKVEQGGLFKETLSVEALGIVPPAPAIEAPAPVAVGAKPEPPKMEPIHLSAQPTLPPPPPQPVIAPPIQAPPPFQPVAPPPQARVPALRESPPEIAVLTQPIREAKKKEPIPIATQALGADEVILHYRLKGGISYIKVPMIAGQQGVWKSEIPGWAVTGLGVEYFIQAKKGFRRFTGEGTKEMPYLIQVK